MPQHHNANADDAAVATRRIRVMLADDHQLLQQGLQAVLKSAGDMQVVAVATDGEQAIEYFRKTIPDVTLMDLRMPGIGGLAAIASIRAYAPHARIIALSTYAGDALVKSAMAAGARGYLLKSTLADHVLDAIRAVHAGQERWPPACDLNPAGLPANELSRRERDVVRLVAAGASNREIGQALGLTEETVKSYMRTILPKLGANDRAHAVAICIQRGILNMWDLP